MVNRIITFDKSAKRWLCKVFGVPYNKNIVGFTKKGPVYGDICSLIALADELGESNG